MKNWTIWLIAFTLQGCWICPDPVFIEHDNVNNTIEVLSEDYYIKSITITEYLQKEGSIDLIDSSKISIEQYGPRGASILSISNSLENYNLKGKDVNEFLKKKNLQYEVRLEKFENKKKENSFDIEIIDFIKDENYSKKKYNTKHPCP
jgi:hypothetical protein